MLDEIRTAYDTARDVRQRDQGRRNAAEWLADVGVRWLLATVDRLEQNARAREGVLNRRVDALRQAERERDDARADVRTLWAMLRRVEWVDGWCPICEHHRVDGHQPDCELARQLRVPHVW